MRLPRLALLCLLGTLAVTPVVAETRDSVIAELSSEGYSEIRISRTWLGRLRFVATGPDGQREIVLNPASGEIMRDYTSKAEPPARTQRSASPSQAPAVGRTAPGASAAAGQPATAAPGAAPARDATASPPGRGSGAPAATGRPGQARSGDAAADAPGKARGGKPDAPGKASAGRADAPGRSGTSSRGSAKGPDEAPGRTDNPGRGGAPPRATRVRTGGARTIRAAAAAPRATRVPTRGARIPAAGTTALTRGGVAMAVAARAATSAWRSSVGATQ